MQHAGSQPAGFDAGAVDAIARRGFDAIGEVAKRIGFAVEANAIRDARDRARVATSAREWLETAGKVLGLRVTWIERTVHEAAEVAEKHGALLAWSESEQRFVALVGKAAIGVRVLSGDDLAEGVMAASTLEGSMGGASGAKLPWAVLEPSLPFHHTHDHGDHPSPVDRLFRILAEERRDMRAVVIYAIAIGLLSLSVPIAVQALVSSVAWGTMLQPIVVLTILVFAALTFEGILRVLQAAIVEWIQQRTFVRTALDMGMRLASVKPEALGNAYAPELANRFFDVVTVQKAAASLLLDGLAIVLQTAIAMVLLAFYHPLLLAFDVFLLALIALVVVGFGRGAVKTAIKESKAKYAVASFLEDIARHQTAFRSGSSRRYAADRIDELSTVYVDYRTKHWKILVRQIIGTRMLHAVASAALLGVGGVLVLQRQLTLGQLVAAELIVTAIVSGVAKLGKHLESWYDLCASVDKLGHVLDLPLENSGEEKLPRRSKGIELAFREVRGASGASINFRLPPGGRIALKGPNGSGKSTLVDFAFGLLRPARGLVTVDGIDVRSLDFEEFRSQVALVRGNEAFEGSIADNVRIGRVHLSDGDIRHALEMVGLLDEVLALPDGIHTKILTSGKPLSHGQTRRLMIARAIVDRPRLLLLDEALDGVDVVARRALVHCLFAKDAPWTLVVTTHVDDVAALCDQRLDLEAGAIRPSLHPEPHA